MSLASEPPGSVGALSRSLLDPVLAVVRALGAARDLAQTLDVVTRAAVEVVGFGAAAVNVRVRGALRVESVVGPAGVDALLGTELPVGQWQAVLDQAEVWGPRGELRFYGHERDQSLFDGFVYWEPDTDPDTDGDPTGSAEPESGSAPGSRWHPEDVLIAPLWDADHRLIGAISVDLPGGGRIPDDEHLTVLEVLALQTARAITDARQRSDAESRRRASESLWRFAFEQGPVGGALLEVDGRIRRANDALARMVGIDAATLAGQRFYDLLHPDDRPKADGVHAQMIAGRRDGYRIERRLTAQDGAELRVLLHVGAIRNADDAVETVLVHVDDITERTRAEQRLARQATHDWLTDLPNRTSLERSLSDMLAEGRVAGVLSCDIDRFKVVNDSLGHEAGDELLLLVARRMAATLPEDWLVGRVGGDDFVVLAPSVGDLGQLTRAAAQVVDAVRRPVVLRGYRHTVEMSVGAAVSAPWHRHADEVLREAEQALERAKRHGRGRIEIYDATQDRAATVENLMLEAELRDALQDGRLEPFFQPVVTVSDAALVGVEALVRWHHPTRGLLLPEEFLPLADTTGLVVPLGWAMLELASQAAGRWSEQDGRWVAVNASGRQLGRGVLPTAVYRALQESGADPSRLHIEVTETALVEASAAGLRELRQVAEMGIDISLDDFGTGYSSLSLLRDLPVTTVKIDRSFVGPITRDPRAAAIVRSVVSLCADLGIHTIAEGVETDEQLAVVRALGCECAQGYLFGAPAPLDARALPRVRVSGEPSG